MTHRLRNVPRGLVLENDDTQSRVNSDSNLSQNRLKRTMRQASWTKPRKLWAWYSQRMKIRRCHLILLFVQFSPDYIPPQYIPPRTHFGLLEQAYLLDSSAGVFSHRGCVPLPVWSSPRSVSAISLFWIFLHPTAI